MRAFLLLAALALLPAHAVSAQARPTSTDLVAAARAQVGLTLGYDGSYQRLAYPGGDVPIETGVCTDVLVRAYRAVGIDLQQRVHEDMRRAFGAYPPLWGLSTPDRNIDHRRVPNLQAYFGRHGQSLPISDRGEDYQPGEVVVWRLDSGLPHIGLVSDRTQDGRPLVIHNIGAGTREEDALFAHRIEGRFRYPAR